MRYVVKCFGVQYEVCSTLLRRFSIMYVVLCFGVQHEVCITLLWGAA